MQNGWNMAGPGGIWHTLVNLVNFADLALHCWYIALLWQSTAYSAEMASSFTGLLPVGLVSTGVLISYIIAVLLPQCLYAKHAL